jgi:hypothetical protein
MLDDLAAIGRIKVSIKQGCSTGCEARAQENEKSEDGYTRGGQCRYPDWAKISDEIGERIHLDVSSADVAKAKHPNAVPRGNHGRPKNVSADFQSLCKILYILYLTP